jgi:hypothetical protein
MSNPMMTFLINIASGLVIFLLGLFWPIIPKSLRMIKMRRFWGKSIIKERLVVAYGAFKDSRHRIPGPDEFWYDKISEGGSRWTAFRGPRTYIVSDCEMRAASYLVSSLSAYRKNAVKVVSDVEAFPNLNCTIISLGSPSSNELARLIMEDERNSFLEFSQNGHSIHDKASGREFVGFLPERLKDYGAIIKIPNRRFPGKFYFVCAGLGEWGTSGASWYLANKWTDLKKEFAGAFGVVVEVELGSDESATRVFP